MPVGKLLIANRGEIAIRIARAAEELGIPSVAIYSTDDHSSLHTKMASESHALEGSGGAKQCALCDGVVRLQKYIE